MGRGGPVYRPGPISALAASRYTGQYTVSGARTTDSTPSGLPKVYPGTPESGPLQPMLKQPFLQQLAALSVPHHALKVNRNARVFLENAVFGTLWYTPVNRDLGLSAHSTLLVAPRAILAQNRRGTKYPH